MRKQAGGIYSTTRTHARTHTQHHQSTDGGQAVHDEWGVTSERGPGCALKGQAAACSRLTGLITTTPSIYSSLLLTLLTVILTVEALAFY